MKESIPAGQLEPELHREGTDVQFRRHPTKVVRWLGALNTPNLPLKSHPMQRTDILTVHLNDYFQGGPVSTVVPRRYWPRFERRIEHNTLELLDLFDKHQHRATFFASGWIADAVPALVGEVARRGHEIASTGYFQRTIDQLSREELRVDAVRSRVALERACGKEVVGYRIARGWISPQDDWVLDVLAGEGFLYDSSLCAFGPRRVDPAIGRPHKREFRGRTIWELPVPSASLLGFNFPISGGNYIRQLPRSFMEGQIARWHLATDAPWMLYFQVSELDPEQPRISALPTVNALRQYRNLEVMRERIRHYLESYRFQSAAQYLDRELGPASAAEVATIASSPAAISARPDRRPVTIVIPCYNEQATLHYLAQALAQFEVAHGHDFDLYYLFIDDGSSDATLTRLHELFDANPKATIVRHDTNKGIAAATLTGIHAAKTETVCVIDCDCSYDPELLARMIPEMVDGVSVVTASPYHREGSVLNVPGWRLFLSRGLSFLYRRILATKLATYTACVRVYRRSALLDLEVDDTRFLGIAEIIARLDERGARIVETPAVLEARLLGTSKMKVIRTIAGHLNLLTRLALRRIRTRKFQLARGAR